MMNFFFNVPEINPDEVYKKLEQGDDIFLLDVREPDEFAYIRIENTTLIPKRSLETGSTADFNHAASALGNAKQKEVIVICRSGVRSLSSAKYLKDNGFANVKSMRSGVIGWAQNGYPIAGNILQQSAIQ